MDDTAKLSLKSKYLATNFIGLAMIASVFVYCAVVEIIKRYLAPFTGFFKVPPQTADFIRYGLFFLTAADYGLIRILQRRYSTPPNLNLPTGAVISFALSEAVALYGLVLFFMTGNSLDFYIFMALSLFFFYIFFPRYDRWEKLMGSGTP
jgi:F0F1-type ATP synthase membrane subunit c/vacuolar-type H+-ATPase subunit K